MRARRDARVDLEVRQVGGARHRVVHVGRGEELAALLVVHAAFEQRLADALREPAVHLALDDHGIDDVAEVVAGAEVHDRRRAGIGIDLDLADVRARRIGEVGGIVERGLVEAGFELVERIVVRHVGGEGDLRERNVLVRALDYELAVLELHVRIAHLHQVRGDLASLGDDLVERLDDRRAADRDRARAVGAHAEGDAPRVTVHDVDVVHADAEALRNHLREGRLVTLAVAVRAGEDRDLPGGMHAHLARFEQPGARAERSRDVGRREPAGLDIGGEPQPALLAALRRLFLALGKTGDVRHLHRALEAGVVVAGVVGERDRRGVRERVDEVPAPDLVLRDLHLVRRRRHQAFDDVGRLGPARAAIGIHRRGVGEHRSHLAVDRGRRVLPG